MSDFDAEVGTEFDAAGEGTIGIDSGDPEGTASPEAQTLAEAQTEIQEGEEILDLNAPRFAYTDEEGNEIQLTGQQIIDLLKGRQEEPPKAEEPKEEAKSEEPTEVELPFEINQINYGQVGPDLTALLAGEDGGEEAIGGAMAEFFFQNYLQDPRYNQVLDLKIEQLLKARESRQKETNSFKQFVGEVPDTDVKSFQKANPWAKTPELAQMGMRLKAMQDEIAGLKSGKEKAVQEAEKKGMEAGQQQTIRNLKAKGTLRAIGSRGRTVNQGQSNDLKSKYDIKDPEERAKAMTEHILRMRGGGN